MSDQLLQHAVENVWCNPGQDQPGIIQLSFFRRVRGEVQQRIKFAYSELSTPTKETYDLFFIGQYQISQWGVDALFNEWQSLDAITNFTKTLLTVFDRQGYIVHPHDVFLIRLPNARVVAAIRGGVGKRDIYLSHYTNAFFSSARALNSNEVWVRSVTFDGLNMQVVLGILTQAMNLKAEGASIRMFKSGVEVGVIVPSTLTVGTPITIMRDDSIDATTYVDVDSLNYMLSGQDNSRKYVIDIGSMDTIQYHDDIEFRVCRLNTDGSLATSLLFHRLQPTNVRMLTESTYSISIDQINHIRLELGAGNCFIAVIARKSGYDRPLIFESSKLHELARLPDNFRQLILTARVPTIKEWSFTHLENSKYVSVMRRPVIDASAMLDVYNAYGYNAIAYYLAPHMTFSPSMQVSVPEVYRDGSVVQYGVGITVNAINGTSILDLDTETTVVEFYQNTLQSNAMDYYNVASIPKTTAEVRFYIRNKTAQDWIDITHAVTWSIDGDTMVHDYQNPLNYWAIRVDGNGLYRQFTVTEDRGIYIVPLIDDNGTIELPYKDVVVRANNRELVQGIDYSIDKQVIWISKKDILGDDGTIVVDVLAEGFPEETEDGIVQWGTPDLYGWTEHGYISYDDTFSLRADKLQRAVVDGVITSPITTFLHEEARGDNQGNLPNGKPYSLSFKRPKLTKLNVPNDVERVLRSKAMEADRRIEGYLTAHALDLSPRPTAVSAINYRYEMYSITCARILSDVQSGLLTLPQGRLTDSVIALIIDNYKELLEYDICNYDDRNGYASGILIIRPHLQDIEIPVSQKLYSLLDRISITYLQGRVDMTGFLSIQL